MSLCAQSALPLAISFQVAEPILAPSKHNKATQVTESAISTNIQPNNGFREMFDIQDNKY